jgi:hypothetical protein
MNVELPVLDYREYQKPLVKYMRDGRANNTTRRAVWVAHRRSGKDVTCWEICVEEAIQDVGTYYYCLPEFVHARRVIFEGMLNDGMRFIDLIPIMMIKNINQSQMKIELVNGSIIQLVGSDQYDRLVGTNPKGIVFSEYSITHPMAWQILRPILAANGGWAIFNGTPRGKNHFHDMLERAKTDDSWFWSVDNADSTGVLSQEVLDKERSEMDVDIFNQEYYCSFDAAAKGAYYSEQIMSLREQNRLCKVPYDSKLKVCTAWDPGDVTTAIVYFQIYGKEARIIDAEEFYSPSVEQVYTSIKDKPYTYEYHFLPFDATVTQMATGMSIIQQLRKLGLDNIYRSQDGDGLPPQKSKMDGIKLVQTAFPSLWIDESLEKIVLEPLSNYAPLYSDKKHDYSKEPEHNWASHMSDAVRYMVIALNLIQVRPKPRVSKRRESTGWMKDAGI